MTDLPSWARKGAKVVCIDDAWNDGEYLRMLGFEPPSRVPMLNEVLTISEAFEWDDGMVALYFVEVQFGWNVRCFRPVVDNDDEVEAKFYRNRKDKRVQRIPHFGKVS